MTVAEAAAQLLQIVERKKLEGSMDPLGSIIKTLGNDILWKNILAFDENTLFVGVARIGHNTQRILASSLKEMQSCDLGPPLHSLILPAKVMHPLEIEYLEQFKE